MCADRTPSRSEVMGWSPRELADYLKRMNLSGCDKTVLKNSINGSRFVNLTDNDLQKFPKLHAPLISKISVEIRKKEEKRGGLFGKKTTTKYHEPDPGAEVQGWGEDEFDDEEFDDDYESPFSGDEDVSGGDYESPNEDVDGNDYEPPPSEPPEDLPHKLCPPLPPGDDDYIDNRVRTTGLPPVLSPRPPVATLSAPMPGESSRRDPSPSCGGRSSAKFAPAPPQICRDSKPRRDPGPNPSPIRGPHRNTVDRPGSQPWKPPPIPPTSGSTSISRSGSSAGPSPNRFNGGRETQNEVPKHNTFPFHNKNLPPRPGLPGHPPRHADSLPPSVPPGAGSLPHKLKSAMAEHRGSFSGSDSRQSFPPPPAASSSSSSSHTQDLNPDWYVGKVTRGQAEGCLKRVNKDGAYLVRDSTRQLANQPFTLMVFYQDKVYNIQIRQQNKQFMLGTGLKAQESFPSVCDIISHYSNSPLLLIDAKNRSSNQQNQCMLSDPAGYYMTGTNWS
ncbi:lymphocyte cytosolic protein 2a isoform X2 [Anabas testudineus]|uniref:lymphocyte cytosolic protein 2a isoform X2 n=1 Tax=Anabas testudineus TaxID=64144 RepID=UPI000E460995|nr:lymphocyte cytosolic protein 2a isoform X2 [Anabas testudineus]